jgi:hypothetical protein
MAGRRADPDGRTWKYRARHRRHDEFWRHSGLTRGLSGARDHSNGTPKLDAVDFGDRKSELGTLM